MSPAVNTAPTKYFRISIIRPLAAKSPEPAFRTARAPQLQSRTRVAIPGPVPAGGRLFGQVRRRRSPKKGNPAGNSSRRALPVRTPPTAGTSAVGSSVASDNLHIGDHHDYSMTALRLLFLMLSGSQGRLPPFA